MWVQSWVRKILWRRKMATHSSLPGTLPGKLHGWKSLAGYSPRSHKRVKHRLVTKQQQFTEFDGERCGVSMDATWVLVGEPSPLHPEFQKGLTQTLHFPALNSSIPCMLVSISLPLLWQCLKLGHCPCFLLPSPIPKSSCTKRLYPVTEILLKIGAGISHFIKLKI